MSPGMTIMPVQSILSPAPDSAGDPAGPPDAGPPGRGRIAAIFLPSITTSARSKSPTLGSRVSTTPLVSIFRPASALCTTTLASALGAEPMLANAPGATAAATRPAALDLMDSRRDFPAGADGSGSG